MHAQMQPNLPKIISDLRTEDGKNIAKFLAKTIQCFMLMLPSNLHQFDGNYFYLYSKSPARYSASSENVNTGMHTNIEKGRQNDSHPI